MVGVAVREHEQVDAAHAVAAQAGGQRRGPGVDQHRGAAGLLQQGGGALAHAEHGERGPRGAAGRAGAMARASATEHNGDDGDAEAQAPRGARVLA